LPKLAQGGVFVTQASSPFFAPDVLSCIAKTLSSVGLQVHPYVTNVPSFGPWGFVLASRDTIDATTLKLPIETRFLTEAMLHHLFELPGDITLNDVEINRLSHPVIVRYQADRRWSAY
ncbi:MAG: spermidine synthase, partial [Chroococcales cyanobacterium]